MMWFKRIIWWSLGFLLFSIIAYIVMSLKLFNDEFIVKSFITFIIIAFLVGVIIFLIYYTRFVKHEERISQGVIEIVDQDEAEKILFYRLIERYMPYSVNPFNVPKKFWLRKDKPPLVLLQGASVELSFTPLHAHGKTGKSLMSVSVELLGARNRKINGLHFFTITLDEGVDWLWHNTFGFIEEHTGGFSSSNIIGRPELHTPQSANDRRINTLIDAGAVTQEDIDFNKFLSGGESEKRGVVVAPVKSEPVVQSSFVDRSKEEFEVENAVSDAKGDNGLKE